MTDSERTYTADEVRALLRSECEKAGSQSAWARAHGVTKAYVSAVVNGIQEPTRAVTYPLGLTKIVHWRIDNGANHV
jgi:hypothetical protein